MKTSPSRTLLYGETDGAPGVVPNAPEIPMATAPALADPPPVLSTVAEPEAERPRSQAAQTQFALKAVGLADHFSKVCGPHRLAAQEGAFRIELSAPEGPSTGGGKQAVQRIKLVPDLGPTIVIGQANPITGQCEVRTYDCVAHMHGLRFRGQMLPFERDPYEALIGRVRAFFETFKMTVRVVDDAPAQAVAAPRFQRKEAIAMASAFAAALLVVLTVFALLYQ